MIEEIETEIEILEEGLGLIVAEPQVRDIYLSWKNCTCVAVLISSGN